MKKILALVLVLGICSAFVAGCSGGGEPAADDKGKPAADKKAADDTE